MALATTPTEAAEVFDAVFDEVFNDRPQRLPRSTSTTRNSCQLVVVEVVVGVVVAGLGVLVRSVEVVGMGIAARHKRTFVTVTNTRVARSASPSGDVEVEVDNWPRRRDRMEETSCSLAIYIPQTHEIINQLQKEEEKSLKHTNKQ